MPQNAPPILDTEDDEDGESGKGDFGQPQLKPNLETLFDPGAVIAEGQLDQELAALPPGVERFGSWELHETSLMLFHRQMKKRLMLAQLDTASKMMKVIVALSTQSSQPLQGQWEIENLIKAMDRATHQRFGKGLYQIVGMVNDSAKLDWVNGTLATLDHGRYPGSGL